MSVELVRNQELKQAIRTLASLYGSLDSTTATAHNARLNTLEAAVNTASTGILARLTSLEARVTALET